MKIWSRLPKDRYQPGGLWVTDVVGELVFGPVRCRGEADNANAASADNVIEDPAKVGGDHPAGRYLVTEVVPLGIHRDSHKYGPAFLRLRPVSGEAWTARENGRDGLGIHGGALGAVGTPNELRATYGCLRVDDETVEYLAAMVLTEHAADKDVLYECMVDAA